MAQLPTQTLSEVFVVTIGINLRSAVTGGALSLALALAPATAQAKKEADAATNGGAPGVWVCNEAGMAFLGGTLDVIDPAADPNPPARHKNDLRALPGHGVGLVNAASNSPALALCGEPAPAPPTGGDTGGDHGGGSTSDLSGTGDGSWSGAGDPATGGGPVDIV